MLALLASLHALIPSPRADLSRRSAIVTGLAAPLSLLAMPHDAVALLAADDTDEDEELEEKLLVALTSGTKSEADRLVRVLEDRGGSQRALTEGPGAFETPWVGAWKVQYAIGDAAAPARLQYRSSGNELRLVASRQFVFGPTNAKEELRGIGTDGGISTEWTYATNAAGADAAGERVLIVKSGSLVKLPNFGYHAEYSQPAQYFQYDATSSTTSSAKAPALSPLPADALDTPRDAVGLRGALATVPAGSLSQISYFSERLWLSRGSKDGALTVLQRCTDRALAPPAARVDLTAPCSETGVENDLRGGRLCRKEALF